MGISYTYGLFDRFNNRRYLHLDYNQVREITGMAMHPTVMARKEWVGKGRFHVWIEEMPDPKTKEKNMKPKEWADDWAFKQKDEPKKESWDAMDKLYRGYI